MTFLCLSLCEGILYQITGPNGAKAAEFSQTKNRRRGKRWRSFSQVGVPSGLDDGDDLAVLDELHLAVPEGEESEVAALPDVLAGMDLRAALADDDGAGLEELSVVGLDAEVLRIRVAAVACRCGSCHFLSSLRDCLDGCDREVLAMADEAAFAFPALRLEVDHLLATFVAVDGERYGGALHVGSADLEGGSVADGANRRKRRFLTRIDRELFNLDLVTDLDKHLLAAGFEYCVCFHFLSFLP